MTRKEAFGIYVNYMYSGGYKSDSVPTKEVIAARNELDLFGIDVPALGSAIGAILTSSSVAEKIATAEAKVESGEIATSEQYIAELSRKEMAETLVDFGLISTEEEIKEVVQTGTLKQPKKGKK